MNASTFDTLAAAETLEAAGIDGEPAKAIAVVIRNGPGDVATKTDLRAATAKFHTAIAGPETRIVERENQLVKWAVALKSNAHPHEAEARIRAGAQSLRAGNPGVTR